MSVFLRNLKVTHFQSLYLTPISRCYSSSPSSSLAEYLATNLGFSEEQSISTATKLSHFWRNEGERKVSNFNFAENATSVVNFLKHHGFSDTHIKKVVSSQPRILSSRVDKTLKPKIELLQNLGFSGNAIVEVISADCKLFWSGLDSALLPTILALRQVMSCDDEVISAIKKTHWRYVSGGGEYLAANVGLLVGCGIPIASIRKSLMSKPGLYLRPTDAFEDLVIKVEEKLGIPRKSGMFLSGLQMLNSLKATTIESKFQVFKSFGWTQSDIDAIIRVHPCCLLFSEQRLTKSLNFLMKELGYEPSYLITCPVFLSYGVEKRLLPRHRILSVLKEKGLIRMNYPLYNAAQLTEAPFLKRFVIPFEEVHDVYTKLTGCSLGVENGPNVEGNL